VILHKENLKSIPFYVGAQGVTGIACSAQTSSYIHHKMARDFV